MTGGGSSGRKVSANTLQKIRDFVCWKKEMTQPLSKQRALYRALKR